MSPLLGFAGGGDPGGSGFLTPDILPNEGFESGFGTGGGLGRWSNFSGGVYAAQSADGNGMGSAIVTTPVYQGTHSFETTFGPNPGGDDSYIKCGYDFSANAQANVWVRVYFYITAIPSTAHKWIRPWGAGLSEIRAGLFLSVAQGMGWADVQTYDVVVDIGVPGGSSGVTGVPTFNTWHSIEYNQDRTNYNTGGMEGSAPSNGGARVQFWYDGVQAVGVNSGPPNCYASYQGMGTYGPLPGSGFPSGFGYWGDASGNPSPTGPYLYNGIADPGHPCPAGFLTFDDTFNTSNTNTGQQYYDRVAISSLGRIGP